MSLSPLYIHFGQRAWSEPNISPPETCHTVDEMENKTSRLDLSALEFSDSGRRHAYLEAIDKLRALGIGEGLSLPQVNGCYSNKMRLANSRVLR